MLEVILYPVGLVLVTPLFIDRLGVGQYGIWILANSIIASIGVLNMGLGDATIKYVSKYRALNDKSAVSKVVQSNYTIYLALAFLVILAGIAIAFLIDHTNLFGIPESSLQLMTYLIPLGSVTLGIRFIEQVFTATFKGFERYDISAQLLLMSKMSILFSNIFLVVGGYSLVHIFAITAIISILMLVIEAFIIHRYVPAFSFLPKYDKKITKEVIGFGLWSWLQSVFIIGAAQLDKFIVASFAGVNVLTYYSLGYMVYSQMHNAFSAGSNWLFPLVSGKIERKETVKPLYNKARAALLASGLTIILIIYLGRDLIFPLWLGDEIYSKSEFFIIGFLAYEGLLILSIIPYYFLNGMGLARLNAFLELILKTLNIVAMVLFFYLWGVKGIIPGLIISLILFLPFQDYIIRSKVFSQRHLIKSFSVLIPSVIVLIVLLGNFNAWKYFLLLVIPFVMKWIFQRDSAEGTVV